MKNYASHLFTFIMTRIALSHSFIVPSTGGTDHYFLRQGKGP